MVQNSTKGTINNVKVTIINLKYKSPVITFIINKMKLSAGQLSK